MNANSLLEAPSFRVGSPQFTLCYLLLPDHPGCLHNLRLPPQEVVHMPGPCSEGKDLAVLRSLFGHAVPAVLFPRIDKTVLFQVGSVNLTGLKLGC